MHCKMKELLQIVVCITSVAFTSSRSVRPFNEFRGGWMIVPGFESDIDVLNLNEDVPDSVVTDKDVGFYYFSRNDMRDVEIPIDECHTLMNTDFDPKRKTLYVVHGWNNDKSSLINSLIKDALLNNTDFNLFIVNWPATNLYNVCKSRVPAVGEIVARFIQNTQQDPSSVFIAGHSLGAHVAGKAGKVLNGRIRKIVGMDPAFPFFNYDDLDDRLDSTDAVMVEVIHTCGGFLGFMNPLGHTDFYPNGGKVQQGCGANWLGICSHSRSYEYFAESLRTGGFLGTLCDTYDNYETGKCDNNLKAYMGGLSTRVKPTGIYFLDTKGSTPYAMNSQDTTRIQH